MRAVGGNTAVAGSLELGHREGEALGGLGRLHHAHRVGISGKTLVELRAYLTLPQSPPRSSYARDCHNMLSTQKQVLSFPRHIRPAVHLRPLRSVYTTLLQSPTDKLDKTWNSVGPDMQHGSESQAPSAPGASQARGRQCIEYARDIHGA